MNTTSFALRRGALMTLILVFATVLAACSSNSDASEPADGDGGTATVADGAVEITAEGLAFDASTIEATSGEDFTITLVNNDSAPHNISIYTEEGGDLLGEAGATAEAGQTVTLDVAALDAGTYYFQCDIHPDMNGTVVVSG
jgi:plastocyanin